MGFRNILISTLMVLLFGVAHAVNACQCYESQPPCADFWQADAVFLGTVTDISPSFSDFEAGLKAGRRSVHFALNQAYRGVEGAQVELSDDINSCEYEFEKGEKYLVYAYRDTKDNTLGTSGCSRTRAVSRAEEDLNYINALSEGRFKQNISGVIQEVRGLPTKGIRVAASGNGKRLQTASDSDGKFKITIPEPGRYKVRIFLPRKANVLGQGMERISKMVTSNKHIIIEYELEIQSGRCEHLILQTLIE